MSRGFTSPGTRVMLAAAAAVLALGFAGSAAAEPDVTPPDTLLISAPSVVVAVSEATFSFESTEIGASFLCSLDGSSLEPCASPAVYAGLGRGEHVFRVWAVDEAGNSDPTPAVATWTIDPPATRTTLTTPRLAYWAPVLKTVVARSRPAHDAPVVARLPARTPERTRNLALALESYEDDLVGPWIRVRLAVLPNGTTGWVPQSALGRLAPVRTRLVVDRKRLTAVLYREGRPVFRARVGVGEPRWPTPAGEFYVRVKLTGYGDPFYGPVAFGTNARSPVLTDWPGGGFIGIHGTNRPELLPGRVSHGCIRMRNADILRLARLLPLGTPLTIR